MSITSKGRQEMKGTKKWLFQTTWPPRIPLFYTLTKIHKLTLTGRPIISGCDSVRERILSFLATFFSRSLKHKNLTSKMAQFIHFTEERKVFENMIPVWMDVTSLKTNIPQDRGINTVCLPYSLPWECHSIPTDLLRDMLKLILLTHRTAELKEKLSVKATLNPLSGRDTLTMFSPCGKQEGRQ